MFDFILAQQNGAPVAALGGLVILLIILALVTSIFWIWMLIDCLTSSKPTNEKVLWFLVIFFLHLLGAIIYFFVARGDHGRTSSVT
jgi:hypothetical protein